MTREENVKLATMEAEIRALREVVEIRIKQVEDSQHGLVGNLKWAFGVGLSALGIAISAFALVLNIAK